MPPTNNPATTTTTFRWLLDTRPLWRDEPFEQSASRALNLLPPHERTTVLKHIFTADRKLRLGAFLLKRLAVHRSLRVPWSAITLSTDAHGKPCYIPATSSSSADTNNPSTGGDVVKFNVSHQAGLVVLIGSTSPTAEVGIDVVSVEERAGRDMAAVRKEGWQAWMDVYAEVFSERELEEMKWSLPVPVSVPVPLPLYSEDNVLDPTTTTITSGSSNGGDKFITLSPKTLLPLSRSTKPDITLALPLPLTSSSNPIPNPNPPPEAQQQPLSLTINSTSLIASKIRNFYAHWCLKEAYIKMTGEALLAPWLRDLEFRNVRPPGPLSASSPTLRSSLVGNGDGDGEGEKGKGKGKGNGKWGEKVDDESFEIYRCGKRIGGEEGDGKVRVELRAWEEGFMVGSAVSVSSSTVTTWDEREANRIEFGEFEELDLEKDLLTVAEAGG